MPTHPLVYPYPDPDTYAGAANKHGGATDRDADADEHACPTDTDVSADEHGGATD
jgi:hypothetical protein